MPLYAKPNSIIATGAFKTSVEYDYADRAEFTIYGLEDQKTAECTIYTKDAVPEVTITAVRNGDRILVTVTGATKPYTIKSAQGLTVEICEK